MLFLKANGVHEPGDTIALTEQGAKVKLKAQAFFNEPVQSLEIVVNGKVVGRSDGRELNLSLPMREGSWIAARATAKEQFPPEQVAVIIFDPPLPASAHG